MERKLAAILAADLVGYSRLIREDEAGTLAALMSHLHELIEPKVAERNGRIVKLMGDGLLAEFPSAVEAVRCAVEIQHLIGAGTAEVPEDKQAVYRIGINIGDIVVEGDDIYGDGVNVAARLEGLAEPGGICIARNVVDHVRGKLNLTIEHLGEREVKNIAEPVTVYRVVLDEKAATLVTPIIRKSNKPTFRHWGIATAVAGVLVAAAGGALWWQPWKAGLAPVSEASTLALTTPPTPRLQAAKPSLAVLPFANMSNESTQEYFADGMTEDLITDLSKISNLTVMSRTSTSGYKGRQIDIREVGKSLGVRYVIEGSVRKVGDQVRINAQLIDATTGGHIWAERYDGPLDDIFGLQDQVLKKIVASLALRLSESEREHLAFHGTRSVAAHDLYLRGLFEESTFTREGFKEATGLYEQALSMDPDYALPYARMANILELSARNGWSNDVPTDLKKAVELAEKAVALDPLNPSLYWSLGRATARLKTPEALKRGIEALQRAIELDPDFADAYAYLAILYVAAGRAEDGLRSVETAMRLNPRYPFWYLDMRGTTRYVLEDYDSAIADFEAAVKKNPTALFLRWMLAASYAQAGQLEDAEWQAEELQMLGFEGTLAMIVETTPIQDPGYLSLYEEGLRKAGIPE